MARKRLEDEPVICAIIIRPEIVSYWRQMSDPRCTQLLARLSEGQDERRLPVIAANASDIAMLFDVVEEMREELSEPDPHIEQLAWHINIAMHIAAVDPRENPWCPAPSTEWRI